MPKILFTCNWGQTDKQLLARLSKQTPEGKGCWNTLLGVSDPWEADYMVVLGELAPNAIGFHPDRTIYILREPHRPEMAKEIPAAFKFTYANAWCAGIWWVERSFDDLVDMVYPDKTKATSAVTTAKHLTWGQQLRYDFLMRFAWKHPCSVDIYGIDEEQLRRDFCACYAGPLPYNGHAGRHGDKWPALADYRSSFCFENQIHRNYFSEKLLDALLAWTMPIYWGCPNLDDFIPVEAFRWLDIEYRDSAVEKAFELTNQGITSREMSAMREARRKILWKYNIWPMVEEIIEHGKLTW